MSTTPPNSIMSSDLIYQEEQIIKTYASHYGLAATLTKSEMLERICQLCPSSAPTIPILPHLTANRLKGGRIRLTGPLDAAGCRASPTSQPDIPAKRRIFREPHQFFDIDCRDISPATEQRENSPPPYEDSQDLEVAPQPAEKDPLALEHDTVIVRFPSPFDTYSPSPSPSTARTPASENSSRHSRPPLPKPKMKFVYPPVPRALAQRHDRQERAERAFSPGDSWLYKMFFDLERGRQDLVGDLDEAKREVRDALDDISRVEIAMKCEVEETQKLVSWLEKVVSKKWTSSMIAEATRRAEKGSDLEGGGVEDDSEDEGEDQLNEDGDKSEEDQRGGFSQHHDAASPVPSPQLRSRVEKSDFVSVFDSSSLKSKVFSRQPPVHRERNSVIRSSPPTPIFPPIKNKHTAQKVPESRPIVANFGSVSSSTAKPVFQKYRKRDSDEFSEAEDESDDSLGAQRATPQYKRVKLAHANPNPATTPEVLFPGASFSTYRSTASSARKCARDRGSDNESEQEVEKSVFHPSSGGRKRRKSDDGHAYAAEYPNPSDPLSLVALRSDSSSVSGSANSSDANSDNDDDGDEDNNRLESAGDVVTSADYKAADSEGDEEDEDYEGEDSDTESKVEDADEGTGEDVVGHTESDPRESDDGDSLDRTTHERKHARSASAASKDEEYDSEVSDLGSLAYPSPAYMPPPGPSSPRP